MAFYASSMEKSWIYQTQKPGILCNPDKSKKAIQSNIILILQPKLIQNRRTGDALDLSGLNLYSTEGLLKIPNIRTVTHLNLNKTILKKLARISLF